MKWDQVFAVLLVAFCAGLPSVVTEARGEDGPESAAAEGERSYWIGVRAVPAPELLRSHLKLEHGLLIEEVLAGSPAEKAGLREGDLLLAAGEARLETVEGLQNAVQRAGGASLTLELLRAGERREVELEPAERENVVPPRGGNLEQVERWLEQLRPEEGEDRVRMFLFRPGVILRDEEEELPAGVQIEITKEGKEPVRVRVKRGEEQWEASADDLSPLPEDLRPHVERMLDSPWKGRFGLNPGARLEGFPGRRLPRIRIEPRPGEFGEWERLPLPEELHREMEELRRRLEERLPVAPLDGLEQLQRQVDELREQLKQLRRPNRNAEPAPEPGDSGETSLAT